MLHLRCEKQEKKINQPFDGCLRKQIQFCFWQIVTYTREEAAMENAFAPTME